MCVCTVRAAALHGPDHDPEGLLTLRFASRLCDAALLRGLVQSIRDPNELPILRGDLWCLLEDVCRRRFFSPHMYFAGIYFSVAALLIKK